MPSGIEVFEYDSGFLNLGLDKFSIIERLCDTGLKQFANIID